MCCSTHWQSCRTQLHCVCMAARYALERRHTVNAGAGKRCGGLYWCIYLFSVFSFFNYFFFETGCQYTALAILKFVAIPLPQLLIIGWNYRHDHHAQLSVDGFKWQNTLLSKEMEKNFNGLNHESWGSKFSYLRFFLMQSILKFVYNFKLVQMNFPKFLIPWLFS